jgi:CBS domain-containing protein
MITESVGNVLKRKEIQEIHAVPATAMVAEAVAVMSRYHIGAIVIRSGGGAVEGILTERDLMKRVLDEGRDPKTTPVKAVMSPDVRRVAPSVSVEESLRLMVVHGHRHLLVADGEQIQGLVSIRDLMSWIVLPDKPIAAEGRVGVIKARAADAISSLQGK